MVQFLYVLEEMLKIYDIMRQRYDDGTCGVEILKSLFKIWP